MEDMLGKYRRGPENRILHGLKGMRMILKHVRSTLVQPRYHGHLKVKNSVSQSQTDRGAKTFLLQRQWLHLCSSLSLSTPFFPSQPSPEQNNLLLLPLPHLSVTFQENMCMPATRLLPSAGRTQKPSWLRGPMPTLSLLSSQLTDSP